jgi:hypothetical protein
MKQILDLRPVYHRLEERIRAHVLLCWLALLLIRIAETSTSQTWPVIRRELDRIHLGTFTGPAGTFRQRTELTKPARGLLAQLNITPPGQVHELGVPLTNVSPAAIGYGADRHARCVRRPAAPPPGFAA